MIFGGIALMFVVIVLLLRNMKKPNKKAKNKDNGYLFVDSVTR